MRDLAKIFQALSDTNRIRILKMLEIRPLCVCEITEILNLANSTVSKHLSLLRDNGFIIDQKEGRWVNYHLINQAENEYIDSLLPLISSWLPDDNIIKQDQKRVTQVDRNIICGT
jgi:ArsR family transcriptional regulator